MHTEANLKGLGGSSDDDDDDLAEKTVAFTIISICNTSL